MEALDSYQDEFEIFYENVYGYVKDTNGRPLKGVAVSDGFQVVATDADGYFSMKVTKDTLIGDVLDFNVETAKFFFEIGMHCLGCPSARGESIEDACMVHGTDADALVKKINDYLATK